MRNRLFFTAIIFLFSFMLFLHSHAQSTKVSGRVMDMLTNEPLAFASVIFKGTTIGAATDINGNYSIEVFKKVDSISVHALGYIPVIMPVKSGKTQVINFSLRLQQFELGVVEIKAGEN